MKKKRSLKARIKTWIFENFLQRYLVSVDKRFIKLFIKYDVKPLVIVESRAEQEYKRIMKVLNSSKFKDYFYKVVKYDISTAESLIKPYSNTLKDRIFSYIAKAYIYLFNREVYNDILMFQRIGALDKDIDDYMANTTPAERLDRATAFGIVSNKKREAQRRTHNIHAIRVKAIHKTNKIEFSK